MTKVKAGIAALLLVATTLTGLVATAKPSSALTASVTVTVEIEINANLRPQISPNPKTPALPPRTH